jgi:hypothetical protein
MATILPVSCACGQVRGTVEVAAGAGQRLVCYCDDCQAYARWLRDGLTDERGGTDIWQTRPSLLKITHGADQLASVRLLPKGMIRWYAGCCRTPVGNVINAPNAPFVGIWRGFVDGGEDVLGPPFARCQGKFAIGGVPEGAAATVTMRVLVKSAGLLFRGWLAGGHAPSPFWVDGQPRVPPQVLTPQERDALRA